MRLLFWFLAFAVICLVIWAVTGDVWEQRFTLDGSVRWLEAAGPWAWAAGIGLLAADLILPVPSTVVMSALGWIYGTAGGGAVAALGILVSRLCGYGIGRWIREPAARRILGNRDYERGHRLFARGGGWMVALSQALPILPEALSCTAGLVRMPFGRFLGSLACGAIPMAFLFAWVGSVGRDAPVWALAFSVGVPAVLWGISRLNRRFH